MIVYLFLAVLVLQSFCNGLCQEKAWDYLVFTQEWPGTFCKYSDCNFPSSVVSGWNIHGVWPSNSQGKDPFNCSPAPAFDINNLQSIYSALQTQWADLKSFDSPDEFWKHEWSKHGTCAIEDPLMPNELGYFSAGLRLKMKTMIQQSMSASGIVPSDSNEYNEEMVINAIKGTLKITPILRCINYDGQLYLSAVEICVDKSFNLMNCFKKEQSDLDKARTFVRDIFRHIHSSISEEHRQTPVNAPCQDKNFLIPLIQST